MSAPLLGEIAERLAEIADELGYISVHIAELTAGAAGADHAANLTPITEQLELKFD